jgi:hypothetical protein
LGFKRKGKERNCIKIRINQLPFSAARWYYGSQQGTLSEGGRLSTIDLLIWTSRFVKDVKNIFNLKRS